MTSENWIQISRIATDKELKTLGKEAGQVPRETCVGTSGALILHQKRSFNMQRTCKSTKDEGVEGGFFSILKEASGCAK
jgi:hypothetical protein